MFHLSVESNHNRRGRRRHRDGQFQLTESFLDQIDDTWQGRGFNSRSEFIRYTLRDAIEFPTFDRDELVALLAAEEESREGDTMTADEARERFGTENE